MLQILSPLRQPRLLLFELSLDLYQDGINVGVVVADLHELLLDIGFRIEEEFVPFPLHLIVDGKDLIELGNLDWRGVQAKDGSCEHGTVPRL